jgi:hypothetical protein
MTLQFGLVGTDGIVLASDRRLTDQGHKTRTSSDDCKFRLNERRTIATAWALKDTGLIVERAIRAQMVDDCHDPKQTLEDIAEKIWDNVNAKNSAQLLVVLQKPRLRLFSIRLNDFVVVHECMSKITTGDEQNPAVYFVERYYQKRPVKELAVLAAQAVLMAPGLNSGSVGDGLDILLCQQEGFLRMSEGSNAALVSQVKSLDNQLEQLIIARALEFAYVPA